MRTIVSIMAVLLLLISTEAAKASRSPPLPRVTRIYVESYATGCRASFPKVARDIIASLAMEAFPDATVEQFKPREIETTLFIRLMSSCVGTLAAIRVMAWRKGAGNESEDSGTMSLNDPLIIISVDSTDIDSTALTNLGRFLGNLQGRR